MEIDKIYNHSCMDMEFMVDDNSVDCIITDPPYGISYQSARRTDKTLWKPKIANDETPYTEWISIAFDKLNIGGRLICFYRWDVQDYFLNEIVAAGFTVKSQLVWDKCAHGMGDLLGEFAPQHELMIYATKGRYEFKNGRPKTVYKTPRVSASSLIHPNEKPINLLQALIRDITEKGELIMDPFAGSGSCCVAAAIENRKFIGFELDAQYVKMASDRILNNKQKQTMF